MSTFITARAPGSRTAAALLMLAGALGGVMAVGAAGAATVDGSVPTLVVRYSNETLATDRGVQTLYRRLVTAADRVCPQMDSNRWVSDAVRACRQQAIARAVQQINNPHLAALHATSSKNG